MKKHILFVLYLFSLALLAQEENQIDSVIFSVKKMKELSIGHPLVSLSHEFGQTVGEDISTQTGAYFKEYGKGMLSSITYRGLGAAHTGVFFEGIPVNSSLNGQVDFNLLYPDGFNEIQFRTGGGGATFGSGAVGGSLHLDNELKYNKGISGNIRQEIASFDTYGTHLDAQFSDQKNALKASLYRLSSNNDYDYSYNHKEYKIQNGKVETVATNVTYQRKIDKKNYLKLAMNYVLADRQLMESFGSTSHQKQKDANHNNVLSWMYSGKKYSHKLSQALLYTKYQYYPNQNFAEYDFGKTKDWVTKYDATYALSSKIDIGAIGQFKHVKGEGSNIGNPTLEEGFLSFYGRYHGKHIKQSLTFSKGVSSDFEIPVTFDYGIEWNFKPVTLHGNITTNYRTPTFNDLYWEPGGNLDLKSEEGWATEIGAAFERTISKQWNIKLQSNGFYSNFTNWIVWLPDANQGGLFSPINIRDVESYGVEWFSDIQYKQSTWELQWNMNYTFLESIDEDTDKQLIYTPKHKVNNQLQCKKGKSIIKVKHQFVDEIYTSSDNQNQLASFNIWDVLLGYTLPLKSINTEIQAGIHNLFDEEYQLVLGRAMPKRNYSIQFNINF